MLDSLLFLLMCVYVQTHMYMWVGVHMYAHNCGSLAQLRHNSSGAVHLIFNSVSRWALRCNNQAIEAVREDHESLSSTTMPGFFSLN